MKSFIHSLSKLVWIKRGFFIRTSFDRLWMEIFPFLFLILKGFYKGFQMRYHLFFNSNGKAVKTIKMFFWKSAMWYIMSMSVGLSKQNFMGNSNFKVSASTFQPELNKLQKCPKLSSKTPFWLVFWTLFKFGWKLEDETLKFEFLMKFCFDRHPSWPLRTETSGDISCFILCFEILTTAVPSIIFLSLSKWCLKYQFII